MALRSSRSDEHVRPAGRRPRIILGRRFALVLAYALGALGGIPAIATSDPSSNEIVSATVYSPSGTTQNDSVSLAQLQSGAQCMAYSGSDMNELGRNGFTDVPLPSSGVGTGTWALSTILGCLSTPVPVSAVHAITVINSDGSPEVGPGSMLTAADLAPQGSTDFNNPKEAPVVEALGSLNQYDRPWRGNGQGQNDEDFLDEVQETQNDQPTPIAIEVFEGPPLTVSVSASQTKVLAGGSVSFYATVTGQNGSPLSYNWNFDGGAENSTAAAPQAAFPIAGQFDVTVQVTDAAGGGGGAEIPITVGTTVPAATGRHHHKGSGKSKKSQSPTGPQKSGGNHAGGRPGNSSSSTSTTTGSNTGKSTSTTSSTTPTSTTPSPTPGSSTKPSSAPHRTATSRSSARHATAPLARPTRPPPASGPLVVGLLVSDITPLAADVSPLVYSVPAAVATAPPARQAIRASLLPPLGAGFAVLVLLGLGAGRELQGRRGRRTPRAHS